MTKVIAVLATLDTKGQEAEFLREQLEGARQPRAARRHRRARTRRRAADVTRAQVARAGGTTLAALQARPTREAVAAGDGRRRDEAPAAAHRGRARCTA